MVQIFILFILVNFSVNSQEIISVLETKNLSTHYRFLIKSQKEKIHVDKVDDLLELEIYDLNVRNVLFNELQSSGIEKKYIKEFKINDQDKIAIRLTDKNVEVFTYYDSNNNKTIIDFWLPKTSNSSVKKKKIKKLASKKKDIVIKENKIEEKKDQKIIKNKDHEFRDFRYGAAIVWNYPALLPSIEKLINLKSKTPEYFYPIGSWDYKKDEKQAHLQITYNLYKKGKYGLMSKSIELFRQKYGEESEIDYNDYLIANSLLRTNIGKIKSKEYASAVILLSNILDRTSVYDLQKAIIKFFIQYYYENKDYIQSLKYSEQFYTISKQNFDQESVGLCIELLLHNLGKLAQVERMEKFISEKAVRPYLNIQTKYAYLSYLYLIKDKYNELAKIYETKLEKLIRPIHSSILFNMAENYFRDSNYEKSISLFDEFIEFYSHKKYASYARNRLAIIYELTDKDPYKTIRLYEESINKSTTPQNTYEAKIRYVAMRNARKIKPDESDREIIVFLENTNYEKLGIDKNIKKILWLTRMRTFLNAHKYQEAFNYLDTIPLYAMAPAEKRIFESDGAEIIYGLMRTKYKQGKYADNINLWEEYKNIYFDKLTNNPKINYFVAHSYLNLGLIDSFERNLEYFEKIKDTQKRLFPIWVEDEEIPIDELIAELKILRYMHSKEYLIAQKKIDEFINNYSYNSRGQYYDIKLSYLKNKYQESELKFEEYSIKKDKWNGIKDTESLELSSIYIESLFKNKKYDRVIQLGTTAINSLNKDEWIITKERIHYLLIESLIKINKDENYLIAINEIEKFNKDYSKSKWTHRVEYLKGITLKSLKEWDKSKKIFENIIKGPKYNSIIKNLARVELTGLRFNNYQL